MKLAGKSALITGASRGVGRAIAGALVAEGMQVVGTSRDPENVDWPEGVRGISFEASSAESAEASWVAGGFQESTFDLVVNNAGSGAFGAFSDTDFEQWENQVGLMLLGVMKVSHLALNRWSVDRPGVLVNVGSLASEFPIPYMSGYNAAKAGLAAFNESLVMETDPMIAKVLELRLGDVNTGFNDHVVGGALGRRQQTVWNAMCEHVSKGPQPEAVAGRLLQCLVKDRDGVVRVGGFFQAKLAPFFLKLVSHRVRRAANISYYNVSRGR